MRTSLGWSAPLLVLALAALSLAGCSTGPDDPASPSMSRSAAASPSGSTTVLCADSRPVEPAAAPPGSADLIIRPLAYRGLANGYNFGNTPDPDDHGVRFFKIGTELAPDARVTVSVDASARAFAGIRTETGPSIGYSSVTYESCAAAVQARSVWWVGGFTLVNRASACVPLTIQVTGESTARRIVLPIETTSCP